jgi:LemA protein
MTWILLALLAVALLWGIYAYNTLINLKGQTLNAWKQIDVQLKRRHDLIPNLVEAVRGAMQFERDTLEAVIQARNQAVKIQAEAGPTSGVQKLAAAEAALTSALGRLNVVVERYPELRATSNVSQLQEELTSTENRVAFSRQLYNDTATTYNVKQLQIPWNLVAGFARAEPVELWEIAEEREREAPRVDLSMKPKQ